MAHRGRGERVFKVIVPSTPAQVKADVDVDVDVGAGRYAYTHVCARSGLVLSIVVLVSLCRPSCIQK